jgi:hypothetical protein
LGETHEFPWYNRQRDGVQRLDVQPSDDAATRHSRWVYRPVNWNWPGWLGYLFEAFGWMILVTAVVIVLWALLRALGLAEFSAPAGGTANDELVRGDIDRVEALPFQLQRPQSDLLAEARRHCEAGEYEQAMIYLYSYQLVQLDRHHWIRLTKGKTNRQYLRELRSNRELWELMRTSMMTFEDVFFGHHRLERDRFEQHWNRLDAFRQMVEPVAV